MTESCSGCRFAFMRGDNQFECHRYPPVPVYGTAEPVWPSVRWNDVCGEWAPPMPSTKPAPAEHREEKKS